MDRQTDRHTERADDGGEKMYPPPPHISSLPDRETETAHTERQTDRERERADDGERRDMGGGGGEALWSREKRGRGSRRDDFLFTRIISISAIPCAHCTYMY